MQCIVVFFFFNFFFCLFFKQGKGVQFTLRLAAPCFPKLTMIELVTFLYGQQTYGSGQNCQNGKLGEIFANTLYEQNFYHMRTLMTNSNSKLLANKLGQFPPVFGLAIEKKQWKNNPTVFFLLSSTWNIPHILQIGFEAPMCPPH